MVKIQTENRKALKRFNLAEFLLIHSTCIFRGWQRLAFEFSTEVFQGACGFRWVGDDEVAGGFEGAGFFPIGGRAGPDPRAAAGEV